MLDGPYRWVRHPIYSGILVALAGTALAVGEWRGALAVVLAFAAFWRKLRIEEALMRRQFGDAYARYAHSVPALFPFLVKPDAQWVMRKTAPAAETMHPIKPRPASSGT
jgi:protein-S-isoprenylcysteine O-methyltransferase Ste14